MNDPFHLQRFVAAQAPVYDDVCAELAGGRKTSHWMWFIFPQLKGLGRSATAQLYGIASRAEADAYWRHRLLGPRLQQCTGLVLAVNGSSALQIFGSPDDLKFHSCMTLFAQVTAEPVFRQALEKYFAGQEDAQTLQRL